MANYSVALQLTDDICCRLTQLSWNPEIVDRLIVNLDGRQNSSCPPRSQFNARIRNTSSQSNLQKHIRDFDILPVVEGYRLSILTISYTLTAALSLVLNIVTLLAYTSGYKCRLRRHIVNLLLSNILLISLSIPCEFTESKFGFWLFPRTFCPVSRCLIDLAAYVNVTTVMLIGVKSFMKIEYPTWVWPDLKIFHFRPKETHLILLSWLFSFLVAAPELVLNVYRPFCFDERVYFDCDQDLEMAWRSSYESFTFMYSCILPIPLLIYLYSKIIWRNYHPHDTALLAFNERLRLENNIKGLKKSFILVMSFFLAWFPKSFQWFARGHFKKVQINLPWELEFLFIWLGYFYTCMSPVLYCYTIPEFRLLIFRMVFKKRSDRRAKSITYDLKKNQHIRNNHLFHRIVPNESLSSEETKHNLV